LVRQAVIPIQMPEPLRNHGLACRCVFPFGGGPLRSVAICVSWEA
jgi:hypothetical protein